MTLCKDILEVILFTKDLPDIEQASCYILITWLVLISYIYKVTDLFQIAK